MPLLHEDLLREMARVRAALVTKYRWFLHETSYESAIAIAADMLRPSADMQPPPEVLPVDRDGRILCLHPLGALQHSGGTATGKLVTLAIRCDNLPARMGLDWSHGPSSLATRLSAYNDLIGAVQDISSTMGSCVAYDAVPTSEIRIHCIGQKPAHPAAWSVLSIAESKSFHLHE